MKMIQFVFYAALGAATVLFLFFATEIDKEKQKPENLAKDYERRLEIIKNKIENKTDIVCEDGVNYLIYDRGRKFGITAKFNPDSTVSTCND